MFWEAYQQTRINRAELAADRAQLKADRHADGLRRLERHVERLSLTCQAMWELVRERTSLTEAELEAKILEVDLRDGQADGKMGGGVIACPSCGRNTSSARPTCILCGAETKKEHIFG